MIDKLFLKSAIFIFLIILLFGLIGQLSGQNVPEDRMVKIYNEIKTPFKYGLVLVPDDNKKMLDSPSVFRKNDIWYMTYIVFDGTGYETWLAKSKNLLDWEILGRLISFSDKNEWDSTQKAGYIALQDVTWGGSYEWLTFADKNWMSYLGGNSSGYEAGTLSVGIAFTTENPTEPREWQRLPAPVLKSTDKDARWWENKTIYKSSVIYDKSETLGFPFAMYYNAKGDSLIPDNARVERIGMAVSGDMVHWKRYLNDPVLDHHEGITGDAVIQKIDDLWVMFYFGAFWKNRKGAFNCFACSTDLVHWTDWTGKNLVEPSEEFDAKYAHKSFVVKWNGVVYHFYCAVNEKDQRGIALAVSKDIGKSQLHFVRL